MKYRVGGVARRVGFFVVRKILAVERDRMSINLSNKRMIYICVCVCVCFKKLTSSEA